MGIAISILLATLTRPALAEPPVTEEAEAPVRRIHGQVLGVVSYCGGAEPADGHGTTLVPYTGVLHLRLGQQNSASPVVAELHPDEDGRFEIEIQDGRVYCVIGEDRLQDTATWVQAQLDRWPAYQHDEACHARQWARCIQLLDPDQATASGKLELKIPSRCGWEMPCVVNAPAPPPSAAPGG
jgi:hypothetical protein